MVTLEGIKFVIFDYDDTLCIHSKHGTCSLQRDIVHSLNKKDLWSDCKPNKQMKMFMDLCNYHDIKMGLLSGTSFFPRMIQKCEWVKQNYGYELENLCIGGSYENKLLVLSAVEEVYGLKPSEILFVDDLYSTVDGAADLGYMTCTPMEVVNFVAEYKNRNEFESYNDAETDGDYEKERCTIKIKYKKDYIDDGILYDAKPSCSHRIQAQLAGGIKCVRCGGWYCA